MNFYINQYILIPRLSKDEYFPVRILKINDRNIEGKLLANEKIKTYSKQFLTDYPYKLTEITPELLIECGFTKNEFSWYCKSLNHFIYECNNWDGKNLKFIGYKVLKLSEKNFQKLLEQERKENEIHSFKSEHKIFRKIDELFEQLKKESIEYRDQDKIVELCYRKILKKN